MQKGDALYPFGLAAAMWRTVRLLAIAWWSSHDYHPNGGVGEALFGP